MVILKLFLCCLPLFSSCFISTAHTYLHLSPLSFFWLSTLLSKCLLLPSLFFLTDSVSFLFLLSFPPKWPQHSHSAVGWPLSLSFFGFKLSKMSIAKMSEKSQWLPAALSPQSNHSLFSMNSWICFTVLYVFIIDGFLCTALTKLHCLFETGPTGVVRQFFFQKVTGLYTNQNFGFWLNYKENEKMWLVFYPGDFIIRSKPELEDSVWAFIHAHYSSRIIQYSLLKLQWQVNLLSIYSYCICVCVVVWRPLAITCDDSVSKSSCSGYCTNSVSKLQRVQSCNTR